MALLVFPPALAVASHGVVHACIFSVGRRCPGLFRWAVGRRRPLLLLGRRGVSARSTSAVSQPQSTESKPEDVPSVLTFQQAIQRLQEYWASVGCVIMQCRNTEIFVEKLNSRQTENQIEVRGPPATRAYDMTSTEIPLRSTMDRGRTQDISSRT